MLLQMSLSCHISEQLRLTLDSSQAIKQSLQIIKLSLLKKNSVLVYTEAFRYQTHIK